MAEFDPVSWAADNPERQQGEEEEEAGEPDPELCPICQDHQTQNIVLVCDGCETCMHPVCAGLDDVPEGDWFCPECVMVRDYQRDNPPPEFWTEGDRLEFVPGAREEFGEVRRERQRTEERRIQEQDRLRQERRGRRENRGRQEQRGRLRAEQPGRPAWNIAWNNISTRIHAVSGLELDFADDDRSMADFRRIQRRASEERRELLEWEERLNSANRRVASGTGGSPSRRNSAGRNMSTNSGGFNSRPNSRGANSRPNSAGRNSLPTGSVQSSRPNAGPQHGSNERRIRDAVGPRQRRRTTPTYERSTPASPELALAWGDLDRAQSMNTSNPGNRKRRAESTVGSPAEPSERQEPERRLKRPRTRAVVDNAAASSSSSSAQTPSYPPINTSNEPSFLSSLLREVESATGDDRFHWSPDVSANEPATSPSAYHLSPATSPSPTSSNYHTPRALSLTPPPQQTMRAMLDHLASSRSRSPLPTSVRRPHYEWHPSTPEIRQPRPRRQEESAQPRSLETSPVRATMPIEVKESINKIVKATLGPHWRAGQLSKDMYSDINRDVSRKMYEIIGDEYANIERDRHAWERIAAHEVSSAVRALRA